MRLMYAVVIPAPFVSMCFSHPKFLTIGFFTSLQGSSHCARQTRRLPLVPQVRLLGSGIPQNPWRASAVCPTAVFADNYLPPAHTGRMNKSGPVPGSICQLSPRSVADGTLTPLYPRGV